MYSLTTQKLQGKCEVELKCDLLSQLGFTLLEMSKELEKQKVKSYAWIHPNFIVIEHRMFSRGVQEALLDRIDFKSGQDLIILNEALIGQIISLLAQQ